MFGQTRLLKAAASLTVPPPKWLVFTPDPCDGARASAGGWHQPHPGCIFGQQSLSHPTSAFSAPAPGFFLGKWGQEQPCPPGTWEDGQDSGTAPVTPRVTQPHRNTRGATEAPGLCPSPVSPAGEGPGQSPGCFPAVQGKPLDRAGNRHPGTLREQKMFVGRLLPVRGRDE